MSANIVMIHGSEAFIWSDVATSNEITVAERNCLNLHLNNKYYKYVCNNLGAKFRMDSGVAPAVLVSGSLQAIGGSIVDLVYHAVTQNPHDIVAAVNGLQYKNGGESFVRVVSQAEFGFNIHSFHIQSVNDQYHVDEEQPDYEENGLIVKFGGCAYDGTCAYNEAMCKLSNLAVVTADSIIAIGNEAMQGAYHDFGGHIGMCVCGPYDSIPHFVRLPA